MRKVLTSKSRIDAGIDFFSDLTFIESILDVGSRDAIFIKSLQKILDVGESTAIDFYSRVEGDINYISRNLEGGLGESRKFEVVVCNDVIEHIENKRKLTTDIFQVSSKYVVISLPNTQHISYIKGLLRGNMGKQFIFDIEDGLDRHRWMTFYHSNREFLNKISTNEGFELVFASDVCLSSFLHRLLARILPVFFVFNQVFVFKKCID